MGTFDVSNRGNSVKRVAGRVLKFTPKEENLMLGLLTGIENLRDEKGGDLLRLDSLNKPAAIETKDGWGMRDRWGYRAVFTFPNTNAFFMGDAGTFNKVGGWVLHELTPQARPVGPAKQRTVGSSIYELVLTAAKVGLGSATTAQSTLRISEGQGVDFKARCAAGCRWRCLRHGAASGRRAASNSARNRRPRSRGPRRASTSATCPRVARARWCCTPRPPNAPNAPPRSQTRAARV
jgi:hypothetical protein